MLTNRTPAGSAAEAAEWGLVTAALPAAELAAKTEKWADQLASAAKGLVVPRVKKLMLASFGSGLEEQMELEGRLIPAAD